MPTLKRKTKIILGVAISLPAVALFYWAFVFPFTTVRTPLAYPVVLDQWREETTSHFPSSIPEDAEAKDFYYSPGALQAPTEMELRLQFAPQDFQLELTRLEGISPTSDVEEFLGAFEKTTFRTGEVSEFTIRVLHCRPATGGDNPSWNHGSTRGYAHKPSTHELIYWTSVW